MVIEVSYQAPADYEQGRSRRSGQRRTAPTNGGAKIKNVSGGI